VVVGAFVVADVISAVLTGRSVLPLPIGNKGGQEDWKAKAVAQLLEDEKKKSAAKMGGKAVRLVALRSLFLCTARGLMMACYQPSCPMFAYPMFVAIYPLPMTL
jgi:hypothetical protein